MVGKSAQAGAGPQALNKPTTSLQYTQAVARRLTSRTDWEAIQKDITEA
jgi:hypothetical protein